MEQVGTTIKLFAPLVVAVGVIVLRHKHRARPVDVLIGASFDDFIELDEVAVNVSKNITRKIGIQEYRSSTNEGFNQTIAGRQMISNIVEQRVLASRPFQKSAIFFHAA